MKVRLLILFAGVWLGGGLAHGLEFPPPALDLDVLPAGELADAWTGPRDRWAPAGVTLHFDATDT